MPRHALEEDRGQEVPERPLRVECGVAGVDERGGYGGLGVLDGADVLRRVADEVAERLQREPFRDAPGSDLRAESRSVGRVGVQCLSGRPRGLSGMGARYYASMSSKPSLKTRVSYLASRARSASGINHMQNTRLPTTTRPDDPTP